MMVDLRLVVVVASIFLLQTTSLHLFKDPFCAAMKRTSLIKRFSGEENEAMSTLSDQGYSITPWSDGDCVIFQDNATSTRLVGVIEEELIYCLKPYGEEFDSSGLDEWWTSLPADVDDIEMLHSHEGVPISTTDAKIMKVLSDVSFTQRICEDRVENPHGEHAEDAYIVKAIEFEFDKK